MNAGFLFPPSRTSTINIHRSNDILLLPRLGNQKMPTFHHLQKHVRAHGLGNKPLYSFCFVALFYFLFDGILSYVVPLVITDAGYSETMMGIIIGSSSITGMLFDFLICRVFRNTNFRRIFMVLFILCAFYPLLLWKANSLWMFLVAMGVWGVYFDLGNIGSMNFLGNNIKPKEHASSSGVLQVFKGLGCLLASLIGGLVIGEEVGWKPFGLAWIFLSISFIFFLHLLYLARKEGFSYGRPANRRQYAPLTLFKELHLWAMTIVVLRPLLLLMVFITIYDSFFWTLGALFAKEFPSLNGFQGLIVAAYQLPILISGWFVGSISVKMGKERVALYAFLLGSCLLTPLYLISNPIAIISLVFSASFFFAFSLPAINGIHADHISSTPLVEKEIEGVNDMSVNLGYVIGPMAAGFLSDMFGNASAFSIVAVLGLICGILLIRAVPKKIQLKPLSDYRISS
jgi:MFS family permease